MHIDREGGKRFLWILAAALGMAGAARPATAGLVGPYVLLSHYEEIALDQPRVAFQLSVPSDPPGEGEVVAPDLYNTALLDTGAQTLLMGGLAYVTIPGEEGNGLDLEVATRPDGSEVQFVEFGVGASYFDVFVPYDLVFAGDDGVPMVLPAVTALGSEMLDMGSFAAVIGMPLMVGRAVTVHLETMVTEPVVEGFGFIQVDFPDTPPDATSDSYHISLAQYPADASHGQQQPGDPLPAYAPLPVVEGVALTHSTGQTSADLIVDTGGQVSIFTYAMLAEMGITDPAADALYTIEVSGVGGVPVEMPMILIDEMVIPTDEGVPFVIRDLIVGALDIEGIDGVLGMNVLTSGYFNAMFETTDPADLGWFKKVVFDFRDENAWAMRLDMNSAYHNLTIPEPATLALLFLALAVTLGRRRAERAVPVQNRGC